MKSGIATDKAAFNVKLLLTSKVELNLRKKILQCYFCRNTLCGAETWTLGKVEQKYLGRF